MSERDFSNKYLAIYFILLRRRYQFLREVHNYFLNGYHSQWRQWSGMSLPVADESGFLRKGVSAYIADVRLLARVN